MSRSRVGFSLLLLAVVLLAAPASAEVFYVTLTNGAVIESSRQPQQASWDPGMILLTTELGNWVGFPNAEIANIRAEDPTEGFGIRISNKAIALGRSPNDLPDETGRSRADSVNDRIYQLSERMLEQAEKQQNYTVNQFVQTEQTQGIPSSFSGSYSGSTGSSGFPQLPAPPPVQPAVPSGNEGSPPE